MGNNNQYNILAKIYFEIMKRRLVSDKHCTYLLLLIQGYCFSYYQKPAFNDDFMCSYREGIYLVPLKDKIEMDFRPISERKTFSKIKKRNLEFDLEDFQIEAINFVLDNFLKIYPDDLITGIDNYPFMPSIQSEFQKPFEQRSLADIIIPKKDIMAFFQSDKIKEFTPFEVITKWDNIAMIELEIKKNVEIDKERQKVINYKERLKTQGQEQLLELINAYSKSIFGNDSLEFIPFEKILEIENMWYAEQNEEKLISDISDSDKNIRAKK